MRNTHQKKLIFSLMAGNRTHPTADEIYSLARKTDPTISRGTVYRNLNLLAGRGAVLRISVPSGPDHFDSRTDRHYHFFCRRCGALSDLSAEYRRPFDATPAELKSRGFIVEYHTLLAVGLCAECAETDGLAACGGADGSGCPPETVCSENK